MAKNSDYLSDPPLLDAGNIEWVPEVVEFEYEGFTLQVDPTADEWSAWAWNEEAYPEPVIIHAPQQGIYFIEDKELFSEHTLSVSEFQLLQKQLTNITQ